MRGEGGDTEVRLLGCLKRWARFYWTLSHFTALFLLPCKRTRQNKAYTRQTCPSSLPVGTKPHTRPRSFVQSAHMYINEPETTPDEESLLTFSSTKLNILFYF